KLSKPWVYAGAVGSEGMSMTIVPGQTPCLRCVFEAAPAPGEAGTCETAGVLGPAVGVIANFQAAEALKILSGNLAAINRDLLVLNLWDNIIRRVRIAPLAGRKGKCPCCALRRFEWLEGEHGTQTTTLCGRNAVQVSHRRSSRLDFETLAQSLRTSGSVTYNKFLLKFQLNENGEFYEFTVFPDGRAIIKGTSEPDKARILYARYVGY
ncbi:MAG: thiazole biosynthesis adenylyltransferase ThiF, partial [Gemmataceae bacterium]|nr:thiazole biosynthesis adenylyltransferase ThiF [Gemmataceae bacterium]